MLVADHHRVPWRQACECHLPEARTRVECSAVGIGNVVVCGCRPLCMQLCDHRRSMVAVEFLRCLHKSVFKL